MVRLFFSERLCHFSNVLYAGSKREMSEMLVRIEDEDNPAHNASSPAKEDDDNPHDARIPAKTPTSKGSSPVKEDDDNPLDARIPAKTPTSKGKQKRAPSHRRTVSYVQYTVFLHV